MTDRRSASKTSIATNSTAASEANAKSTATTNANKSNSITPPAKSVLQRVTELIKKDKDICKLRAEIFKVEQFLTSFVPKKVKAPLQGDINQGYGLIVLSLLMAGFMFYIIFLELKDLKKEGFTFDGKDPNGNPLEKNSMQQDLIMCMGILLVIAGTFIAAARPLVEMMKNAQCWNRLAESFSTMERREHVSAVGLQVKIISLACRLLHSI